MYLTFGQHNCNLKAKHNSEAKILKNIFLSDKLSSPFINFWLSYMYFLVFSFNSDNVNVIFKKYINGIRTVR